MKSEIYIAIIGAIPALITAIVSIIVNNRLLGFKIDELSDRVEKHNNVIERTYRLEEQSKTLFSDVSEIKADIRSLQELHK